MDKIQNLGILLFLVVALAVSTFNVPIVQSTESTVQDKSLAFISDVLMLDVERYNVTLESNVVSFPDDLGGLPMDDLTYTLESNDTKLAVLFTFRNKTLSWCMLSVREGSPLFTQTPSTNVLERANTFLEKYQNYLGDPAVQQYMEILSNVNEETNTTITEGNVSFELTVEVEEASFSWVNTFNGAKYTKIDFSFWNNGEFAIIDDRYNKIGSTDVKISKDEAVALALERVENMSWTVEGVKVGNVSILDNRTSAALLTAPKEPLVLYPYWQVSLTFDKVYPGNVYGVTYNIWADTGEIFYGHMHMFGGEIPEFPTWTPLLLALCTVAVALVIYKQKLHKNHVERK